MQRCCTEKLLEGMTGGDVDIEADGSMPQDFPSEVPVINGEILAAVGMTIDGAKTWQVSLRVDDAASAANLAREKLVGAGFEETMWSDTSPMILGVFSNDSYQVHVSAAG